MDFSNKKTRNALLLAMAILILTFFVFLSFFIKNKIEQKKSQNPSIFQSANRENLIRKKIGNFSIEEEQAYQGGTIIKGIIKKGDMSRRAILFFKDNELQKIPDEYIIDLVKSKISDSEEKENIVSAKYQEEYNFGNKDKDGKDIVYNNIYLIINELPKAEWVENAMYPKGPAKYQIFVVDEFGQTQFNFLSSEIL